MQRGEQRSGPRQVAFGLCDSGFYREGIDVVRRNIENLIKLSQRFGETTKVFVGERVLAQQRNVPRVKSFSFVEVRLAPVPLASPARDIGQHFRDPAAIRQELTRLLKVTHRSVVIR